jgi:hypothetical protein
MASTITTNGRCETCKGAGTVAVTRSRWIGGGKEGYCSERTEDVRSDGCNGAGSLEPVSTLDPAYADVPDFASYDDYSAWFADDLRDAQLEHELDCEVAS